MRIEINNNNRFYSGPFGFLAQLVVMTLAAILAAYILPGVRIDSVMAAILTAAVIALLNTFIRPILIVITLPFTIVSMGLFLIIINALIILMTEGLVSSFHVDSFWSALLFSLLLTAFDYLLEIPNKLMRRPKYQPSDQEKLDEHADTDADGFTSYEEIESSLNEDMNNENQ
ncbi:MAG: phage holin family protein [Bacteroidales bacterium]|jgi:putative membrane protein|nr:phage holin family protein [Bacteroidales bacterium]